MAQLAIKGHATRGSEVIALLEMFGGVNRIRLSADNENIEYTINKESKVIQPIITAYNDKIFTLEQFEKKFPYKIGDKVMTDDGDKANIVGMVWDDDVDDVFYKTQVRNGVFKYPKELLQPYMETITIDDFKDNTKEWLIDKLHGMIISDAVKIISNIHYELHKPKYPKTYEECARLLNTFCGSIEGHKEILLVYTQQLLICRDAYWKLAGEEMGLGKSWEPDWSTEGKVKYVIEVYQNKVRKNSQHYFNTILAFPTEEMRNAFYENFNDLIEVCKELL